MYCIYNQNVWNCNPTAHRNKLIRELIALADADVCTFQEFSPFTIRIGEYPLQDLLMGKYTEVNGNSHNFTPIFYKTEKFNLVNNGYYLYTGMNDADSKSITWAVLENKENGEKFAVLSTHLWWMAESEKDNLQRLENVKELKDLCDDIIKRHNVPVIVGGDFNNGENAPQGDEPYKKMLKLGFKDMRLTAKQSTNCYTQRDCLGPDGIQDTSHMPCRNIDYIFAYGADIKAERFVIPCSRKALDSSDHLPLLGYFNI